MKPLNALNKMGKRLLCPFLIFSFLNPNEIESISVLKYAASTSLYGSRATKGVVIVSTKRAKTGQTSIGVNSYYDVQRIPEIGMPDVMNAREFT